MNEIILPYQGKLIPLLANTVENWAERVKEMPQVRLSKREAGDLDMLGIGGFSPLQGFMSKEDWSEVCRSMRTRDGMFWPIPITLACDEETKKNLKIGKSCSLIDPDGELAAILYLQDIYKADKELEAKEVFLTTDIKHPGVANLYMHGDYYLGGEVQVLKQSKLRDEFAGVYMTPPEARQEFEKRGWRNITAFQTRNPMHRAHEHLVKLALETCDGVFVHSLLGNLKQGDIPADVRIRAIDAMIKKYFTTDSVINAGYPLDMRYAGPREALLHALFRQNYGCNRIIIGRDHAGVGSYYEEFAAQEIFEQIPKDALQIKPLKLEHSFWCNKCNSMASSLTCPHPTEERMILSGTKLRELLSRGEPVPENFSRPEVIAILREYYRTSRTSVL